MRPLGFARMLGRSWSAWVSARAVPSGETPTACPSELMVICGDGVEGAFDQDGDGPGGQVGGGFVESEQLLAFVEDFGAAGVEVLGAGVCVVVLARVASGDESGHVLVAVDREDEAVTEGVDEVALAGDGAESGGDDLGVSGPVRLQMPNQACPSTGGVAGGVPVVAGQVGAEPVPQIPRRP